MKLFARLPLCAGVAVVLVSTFAFLVVKLGGQQTRDGLDLLKWAGKLGDELRRSEVLDARSAPIFRRTVEKQRLAHELIAHQLTPRDAVAQLRALNEEIAENEPNPDLRPSLDEQSLWHSLLVEIRGELLAQPTVADDVTTQLEREMNEQGAAGG